MAETYFKNFNIISYANNYAVDLTERVVGLRNALKNPYIFYPMTIVQGVRPDQLAYGNYQDPYTSWLLYITNDIIDPYYEWYLTDYQLTQFIKEKYGTLQNAMDKVAYYRNDYVEKNSITPAAYNALTYRQKEYWEPQYAEGSRILEYTRKKLDLKTTTNYILKIGYFGEGGFTDSNTGLWDSYFKSNEVLKIQLYNYDTSRYVTGKAQFIQANSSAMLVQHVSDDAFPHDNIITGPIAYVYGTESGANVSITNNSISFVSNNIPSDVLAYYTPVYYYDLEVEKNEGNKTIRLLQPEYVPDFLRNFKTLLSQ
jgi:hypothetical protein